MPTIPFPHVSWLQLAAPPVPTRALKNIIIREYHCPDLAAAIEATRVPDPAPFPREDPPEPEEPCPIPLCMQEPAPWSLHGTKISSVISAIYRVTTQQTAAGPYANIGSDSTKPTTLTRTNATQERPPPEL